MPSTGPEPTTTGRPVTPSTGTETPSSGPGDKFPCVKQLFQERAFKLR